MTTHGVVQTEPGRDKKDVFEVIEEPACRFALLHNPSLFSVAAIEPEEAVEAAQVSGLIQEWRKSAFLDDRYRVTRRAWLVSASLLPGIALSEDGGMSPSRGGEAITGFFNGNEHYRKVVEDLLEQSVGFTLKVPGDATALMVAEAFFERCVTIGESRLISELPVFVQAG